MASCVCALSHQGLSNNMIWSPYNFYRNQGQVFANGVCTGSFPIRGGVCGRAAFGAHGFSAPFWTRSVEDLRLELRDGGPALLDFRFADDSTY